MPYSLVVDPDCEEEIARLTRKNSTLKEALEKKTRQILANPHAFKPLKKPLQGRYRVHVLSCFVLIYEILEEDKAVLLLQFSHHDEAYR